METIGKMVVWFVVSTTICLVAGAPIVAGLNLIWLGWAHIPVLSSLGFWQLYWLQMFVYESITGCVTLGIVAHEYFD